MRYIEGLGGLVRTLEGAIASEEVAINAAAEASSVVMHHNVRMVIGDSTKLTPLVESTQEERSRLGYAPNDPLLRDGELILASVKRVHDGNVGGTGSKEPVAAYQEGGYINARTGASVPPRPSFAIGFQESLPKIEEIINASVGSIFGGPIPTLGE